VFEHERAAVSNAPSAMETSVTPFTCKSGLAMDVSGVTVLPWQTLQADFSCRAWLAVIPAMGWQDSQLRPLLSGMKLSAVAEQGWPTPQVFRLPFPWQYTFAHEGWR
jgi:hypothetical protein